MVYKDIIINQSDGNDSFFIFQLTIALPCVIILFKMVAIFKKMNEKRAKECRLSSLRQEWDGD